MNRDPWGAAALLVGGFLGGPVWTPPTGLVLRSPAGPVLPVGTVRRPPVEVDGTLRAGVPANGQPFTAAAPRRELEDRRQR